VNPQSSESETRRAPAPLPLQTGVRELIAAIANCDALSIRIFRHCGFARMGRGRGLDYESVCDGDVQGGQVMKHVLVIVGVMSIAALGEPTGQCWIGDGANAQ